MAKVLLIDDSPELVFLTRKLLEKEGHQVISAEDGKKGLQTAFLNKPDVILLDIMMPVEDGWAVCKKLKSDKITKNIPVIMFSVKTEIEVEEERTLSGCDAYITKPFNNEDFLKIIHELL
jgi:twitching motility two-component system response regulator PilH